MERAASARGGVCGCVQKAANLPLRFVARALAEVAVHDLAVLVDEVQRRPVAVLERIPGSVIVVLRDRIRDVETLDRLLEVGGNALVAVLRRSNDTMAPVRIACCSSLDEPVSAAMAMPPTAKDPTNPATIRAGSRRPRPAVVASTIGSTGRMHGDATVARPAAPASANSSIRWPSL
ncbi:MAG TPA: hypothetical protein VGD21_11520 [Lysobacter sp.]